MIGKRSKKAKALSQAPTTALKVGDKVLWGSTTGKIKKLGALKAVVIFDDLGKKVVRLKELRVKISESESKKGGREEIPLSVSGIQWNHKTMTFKLVMTKELDFYGWWRKSRLSNTEATCWVIDMYARKALDNGDQKEFSVESMSYMDKDPMEDLKSLNHDIIAAANKWLSGSLHGDVDTIDALVKRAQKPVLRINRIDTIDHMIAKLHEYRNTAIRSGGERVMQLEGNKGDPPVTLFINVTSQAIALDGKPPALYAGGMVDAAIKDGKRGGALRLTRTVMPTASPENLASLVARLKESKDKAEQRKIREVLRKLGHKGGGRPPKKEEKAETK